MEPPPDPRVPGAPEETPQSAELTPEQVAYLAELRGEPDPRVPGAPEETPQSAELTPEQWRRAYLAELRGEPGPPGSTGDPVADTDAGVELEPREPGRNENEPPA